MLTSNAAQLANMKREQSKGHSEAHWKTKERVKGAHWRTKERVKGNFQPPETGRLGALSTADG